VEKAIRVHDNLVLRKTMMERNKNVVSWDSQIAISQLDEQGVDDVDEEDSADEQKVEKSSIFCVEITIFLSQPPFFLKNIPVIPAGLWFRNLQQT
jgi:hypothetical protein